MPGESRIAGGVKPIKLSSNEGAFGPPPGAIEAIRAMAAEAHRYPDGGATALREAIKLLAAKGLVCLMGAAGHCGDNAAWEGFLACSSASASTA